MFPVTVPRRNCCAGAAIGTNRARGNSPRTAHTESEGEAGDSPQPQVQRKEGGEADHLREQKERMRVQKERYRERDTKRGVIETKRDGETEAGDEMKPDKGRHLLNQAKNY